jgi:hypothetical protein
MNTLNKKISLCVALTNKFGKLRPDQVSSVVTAPCQFDYFNITHQRIFRQVMKELSKRDLIRK